MAPTSPAFPKAEWVPCPWADGLSQAEEPHPQLVPQEHKGSSCPMGWVEMQGPGPRLPDSAAVSLGWAQPDKGTSIRSIMHCILYMGKLRPKDLAQYLCNSSMLARKEKEEIKWQEGGTGTWPRGPGVIPAVVSTCRVASAEAPPSLSLLGVHQPAMKVVWATLALMWAFGGTR